MWTQHLVSFYHGIWLAKEKTEVITSRKLFPASGSQTLFFGGDKRRPKIRLRSQAKCRATNSQTNSQPQNTPLNLLTVTFLAILKVNRDKLALINRQWKCKKGKRLVITANFEEQNLGAVCNLGPRWENPDRWSARLANQIQRFRIPDR